MRPAGVFCIANWDPGVSQVLFFSIFLTSLKAFPVGENIVTYYHKGVDRQRRLMRPAIKVAAKNKYYKSKSYFFSL